MTTFDDLTTLVRRTDVPMFLVRNNLTTNIAEIGVRFGYNFQQLLSCNPDLALAIDHWSTDGSKAEQDTGLSQDRLDIIYSDICKRFLDYNNVHIWRMKSDKAAALVSDYSFDYVYLDADHSYDGCLRDIRWWWPKVRQGGVLAGHDYINTESKNGTPFGVIQAVATFVKEKNLGHLLHTTKVGYKSWFLYKEDGE